MSWHSISDQSDGGAPLFSPQGTPQTFLTRTHDDAPAPTGDREMHVGSYAHDPYTSAEPEPRPDGPSTPPSPTSDSLSSNHSSVDSSSSGGAPLNPVGSTINEPNSSGSVTPRPIHPLASGQEYLAASGPGQVAGQPSTAITNLETTPQSDEHSALFNLRIAHQRILGVMNAIHKQAGLPDQFADRLEFELSETGQNLGKVTTAVDNLGRHLEGKMTEFDRVQATAGLQAVEIERLRQDVEKARMEAQSAEQSSAEMQKTYQDVIRSMDTQLRADQAKIKLYEEQLNGHRHLFYGGDETTRERSNTTSFTGVANMSPAGAASTLRTGLRASGSDPNIVPPRSRSAFFSPEPRPAAYNSPRSNSAFRPGHRNTVHSQYNFDGPGGPFQSNEPGSHAGWGGGPGPAIVTQASPEIEAMILHWQTAFGKVFSMVHGWCTTYAGQVKPDDPVHIQTNAPKLWEHMCELLCPSRLEDGAFHARQLLLEPPSRVHLVERIMLQYIINTMFSVEAWSGFRQDTDIKLKSLWQNLQSMEPYKVFERQRLVDQISSLVNTILLHEEFAAFRQRKENFHQQRLKTIVGPLMTGSTSHSDAAFELSQITGTALQTSANILQSRLDIRFLWDETYTQFIADQHAARDRPAVDPAFLQANQFRLKLVITPGITIRDVRAMGAAHRAVLRSEVLVMN